MVALIAYGSLIDKQQLAKEPRLFGSALPVWVQGYRRTFNQEPSWREGRGERRAVLNVIPSESDAFNGVLVRLQDDIDLDRLDDRERGYDRVTLDRSRVVALTDDALPEDIGPIFIYTGKPEKRNDDILPNDDYLNLCLAGAMEWSEDFYRRFLETTYVGASRLRDFLRDRRQEY